jgi:hypothetical protein
MKHNRKPDKMHKTTIFKILDNTSKDSDGWEVRYSLDEPYNSKLPAYKVSKL